MFKAFGHRDVSILDGGLPGWEGSGCKVEASPLESTAIASTKTEYRCELIKSKILSMTEVEENIKTQERQIIDARPFARFIGEAPEPRPIESGHIEGMYCVPWAEVLNADGYFKAPEEIRKVRAPFWSFSLMSNHRFCL